MPVITDSTASALQLPQADNITLSRDFIFHLKSEPTPGVSRPTPDRSDPGFILHWVSRVLYHHVSWNDPGGIGVIDISVLLCPSFVGREPPPPLPRLVSATDTNHELGWNKPQLPRGMLSKS